MLHRLQLASRQLPRTSLVFIAAMSTDAQASKPKHYFLVYAPDKTEEGTFDLRMSVRPKHLEAAKGYAAAGLMR